MNFKDEHLPLIYGPVESRRHGVSLGVNLGLEHKVCTWGCVYCQCGFGERRDFTESDVRPSPAEVLDALKAAILKQEGRLDSVTFAGNTDPGTYPDLPLLVKNLIRFRVMSRSRFKIIILSNGSELDREEVRMAYDRVDEAWIKLDVATPDFHRLSRPLQRVGEVGDHLERIKKLKNIRIQTMLWDSNDPHLGNAGKENLLALASAYQALKPIQVQVMTIARDPALKELIPVDRSILLDFAKQLNERSIPVEVI